MKGKILLCAVMAFVLFSYSAWAQQSPKTMRATSVTTNAYMREISPLSQMDNIIAASGHVAPPKRRGKNTVAWQRIS